MFLLLTHDSFLDEVSFNCSLLIAHMPQPLILDAETHQPNNNSHCVPHISLSMPFTCSCFISSVLLSSLSITPRLPARSTILQLCSSTSSFFSLRTCTTASSSSISSVSFSFTDLLEVSSCSWLDCGDFGWLCFETLAFQPHFRLFIGAKPKENNIC